MLVRVAVLSVLVVMMIDVRMRQDSDIEHVRHGLEDLTEARHDRERGQEGDDCA